MCKWTHPLTGLLLTGFGVVYLLLNFGVIAGAQWDTAWKLWPIFLVLMGVHKLMGDGHCGQ